MRLIERWWPRRFQREPPEGDAGDELERLRQEARQARQERNKLMAQAPATATAVVREIARMQTYVRGDGQN